jgi:hypothetical protein
LNQKLLKPILLNSKLYFILFYYYISNKSKIKTMLFAKVAAYMLHVPFLGFI